MLNERASSASSSLPRRADRLDLGQHGLATRIADGLDQRRQLLGCDLVGGLRHGLHPAGHRAGEQQGDQRRQQHGAERDQRADERLLLGLLGQRLGAVDDRPGDVLLEVEALVGQRPEPLEVELGAGAGLGCAAGGVELEPVLRQRGRESALAELLRPLLGSDRAELVHHRFDLGVPNLGGGERRRVGDVLVELLDVGGDGVGGDARLGELHDGEQLTPELGVAGLGRQQLADRHELAEPGVVGDDRVDVGRHPRGEARHVDRPAGARQVRLGLGDVLARGLGRAERGDVVAERGQRLVGGAAYLGEVGGELGVDLGDAAGRVGVGVGRDAVELGLDGVDRRHEGCPDGTQVGPALCVMDLVEVIAHSQRKQRTDRDHQRQCGGEQLRRQ